MTFEVTMSVAVLVPVCSRAHAWKTLDECFFMTRFLPSFEKTKDPGVSYQIYIGVDDDDHFFLDHKKELELVGKVVDLAGCQHSPAWAWNELARVAYNDGHEYLFQIGDDVQIQTPGWTEKFITKLKSHRNKGVVGPKNPVNFALRVGGTQVIENAFVHRSHMDLFGYFFHPVIRNWHCDEWLTQIYTGVCSHTFEDIIVDNGCIDKRYQIQSFNVRQQIEEGRRIIRQSLKGCFSFCIYGPYTDKYYRGLFENVDLVKTHYPNCDIRIYTSQEALNTVKIYCQGVKVEVTDEVGSRNKSYRFLPTLMSAYDFVCVRDTDSRIHERDRWCIDHFLDSPYTAYTIRDHKWHEYKIMAGMWGCKGKLSIPGSVVFDFVKSRPDGYAVDADFLNTFVYPIIRKNMIVYSYDPKGVMNDPTEKVCVIGHPIVNGDFCGQVVLFNDKGPYNEFAHV